MGLLTTSSVEGDLQPDGLIAGLAEHCRPDKDYRITSLSLTFSQVF